MSTDRAVSAALGKTFEHRPFKPIESRTIMVPAHTNVLHYVPCSVSRLSFDKPAHVDEPETIVTEICRVTRIGSRRVIDWRGFAPIDPSLPEYGRSALFQKKRGAR